MTPEKTVGRCGTPTQGRCIARCRKETRPGTSATGTTHRHQHHTPPPTPHTATKERAGKTRPDDAGPGPREQRYPIRRAVKQPGCLAPSARGQTCRGTLKAQGTAPRFQSRDDHAFRAQGIPAFRRCRSALSPRAVSHLHCDRIRSSLSGSNSMTCPSATVTPVRVPAFTKASPRLSTTILSPVSARR